MRFVSGNPPHLAIRGEYRLANVGTTPLDSVEIDLPDEKGYGRENLHIKIDGREVAAQRELNQAPEADVASSESAPSVWRIPFASRWARRQSKTLLIEYNLAAHVTTDPRISVGSNAFYLNDSGWFPAPLPLKALFATNIARPNPSDLIVDVPANFVATASGVSRGTRKQRSETVHRFRLGKDDPDPFVAAGAYQQQPVSAPGGTVSFWTLQSFPSATLQETAKDLASTDVFVTKTFGTILRANEPLLIVQAPSLDQNSAAASLDNDLPSLPDAVLFSPSSFSQEASAGTGAGIFERRLALLWFEHAIRPRPEAWLLGDSLAAYVVTLANENSGATPGRGDFIRERLTRFDQLRDKAVEKPMAFLAPGDPPQQREIAAAKSTLFVFALEGKCGRENLEHAIAHMVYALRGQEYGYNDFRAALEQECHQDLSSVFATWLDQKGIPADFRARYEKAGGSTK